MSICLYSKMVWEAANRGLNMIKSKARMGEKTGIRKMLTIHLTCKTESWPDVVLHFIWNADYLCALASYWGHLALWQKC